MRFHLLEDGLVGLKPVPLLLRVNISNAKIILFQQAVIVADVIYEKLTFRFPLFLSSVQLILVIRCSDCNIFYKDAVTSHTGEICYSQLLLYHVLCGSNSNRQQSPRF